MSLALDNLTFKPTKEYHLNNVSLHFEPGKMYTILGRTLSGKTTLLKTIAGLLTPDSGSISFEGNDFLSIPVWNRNIAMVYQQFINYPHLNVQENIEFPLKQRKMDPSLIEKEVSQAIQQVGLLGFESRKIQELSGGQQQRVALARSLAKKAKILLLDEPLVNLDYKLREGLREEFKKLFSGEEASQSILIYASTDPLEAMQLNGDTIVIDEGQILQSGSAKEVFENPSSAKVAEITNDPAMNINEGLIKDNKLILNQDIIFPLPNHLKNIPQGKYLIGIRATDLYLDNQGFNFDVDISEISGSETFLHLHNQDIKCVATIEEVKTYEVNDRVKINFDLSKIYLFKESGELLHSPYKS
ncbi:ABC transporter ATP-binding protein [Alphaproteobacteria bacterium]|nr:ABC transporter ATP-binding protein [Alphaproteobacteria bacterium]MDB3974570.1 ABC transporter ATP-binding protein [Alphaproteobacteria bacterium]